MTQEIPAEVQRQIDKMSEAFRQKLSELYRWSSGVAEERAPTAIEIEDSLCEWLHQLGEEAQKVVLGGLDVYQPKGKQPCPECGEEIYWKRYESRNYITALGTLELERAYYYHGACRCGWLPLDERLGLGASELSPRVQEMVSYLGGFMPFEQAQAYLEKYQRIQVSHDTVNTTTVAVGRALRDKQEAEVQLAWETARLPACEVDTPPQRLYVSADGINHLLPDGQGHEIKVAAVYVTEERQTSKGETEIHAVDIDYVVATTGEELAKAAYLRAVKRGAELAEQIIVLGDGAPWIWNRVAAMFPARQTTEVVDFYHASEYLWGAAQATWGQDSNAAQAWSEQQCHALKHEGPAPVLQALTTLTPNNTAWPEPLEKALSYFENQTPRMQYPDYIEQGLQIGSGSAESGVKQVVGVRMNQAGMRWNAEHAEAVAHVRAIILSGRWDSFWRDFRPPPRQYQHRELPLAA